MIANSLDQVKSATTDALISHAAHQDHANIAFLLAGSILGYNTCTPTNDFRKTGDNSESVSRVLGLIVWSLLISPQNFMKKS